MIELQKRPNYSQRGDSIRATRPDICKSEKSKKENTLSSRKNPMKRDSNIYNVKICGKQKTEEVKGDETNGVKKK